MMIDVRTYKFYVNALLVLFLIVAVGCAWSVLNKGIKINTDLKNLSPAIAQDPVINDALDNMSRLAASQFILVLTHPDETELEDASDALREKIAEHEKIFHLVDRSDIFADYLAELERSPFNFLDSQAQAALQTQSDQQLQQTARARLYGSSAVRLIPPTIDPFGYTSDFALQAMTSLGEGGDATGATTIDGEEVFFAVHNLMLASGALDMGSQEQVVTAVQQLEAEIQRDYSEAKFFHSGIFFFAADAAQSSKKDIGLISTGSAIGVILLMLLIFRSVKALLLPALSIAAGTAFAFVVCQVLFGTLHIFTLIFGASLIGVVVDYALHYFYFHSHREAGADSRLFRALLLSLITSVIGYSALSWSGLDALKQVAVFSGLGLIFSWLVVISLGPFLVRGVTLHDAWLNVGVRHTLDFLARIKSLIWLIGVAVIGLVLMTLGQFQIPSNDSPRALFSPNAQLIKEEQLVNSLTGSNEPGSFVIVRSADSQEVYQRIEQLEQQLAATTGSLIGVHNFFPSPENAARAFELNQRLYADNGIALEFMRNQGFTKESIEQLQDTYRKSESQWLSPADFFARHADQLPALWLEHEQQISTFLLIPKATDLAQLKEIAAELDGVSYISVVEETTRALQQLRHSALTLLLVAFALIAALMMLRFRSLRMTLKVLTVPFLTLTGTVLLLSALHIPMTLFHVMALFLVLGLGMDYIIFVIEMQNNPQQTLSAIVLSALTSLLSFGLLAASDLPAVSGFGLTVLIGNCLNLIGSLVLASRRQHSHA